MAAPGPGRDFPGFPKFCGGVVLMACGCVGITVAVAVTAVHRLKPTVVRRTRRRT